MANYQITEAHTLQEKDHPEITAMGAAAAGVAGAGVGMIAGGPPGAIIGAVVGAIGGGVSASSVVHGIDDAAKDTNLHLLHEESEYIQR